MDRAAMVKQLVEMGFEEKNLDGASDELLAQMLKLSEPEEGADDKEFADLDLDAKDDDKDKMADEPPSDEDVGKMSEDEAKEAVKKYRDKFACKMAEEDEAKKKADADAASKNSDKFSETRVVAMIDAAVAKALDKHASKAVAEVQKFAEMAKGEQKRGAVTKFCETLRDAGKIQPWELDDTTGEPTIIDRLMACDPTRKIFKYSEGGKQVGLTQLEVEMRAIEARPAHRFNERIKPGGTNGKGAEDAEVAKVEEHFEKFSEQGYLVSGMKKEDFVAGFKAAKKHDPELTAEEFVGAR